MTARRIRPAARPFGVWNRTRRTAAHLGLGLCAALVLSGPAAQAQPPAQRVVSLGGAVTEIAVELGAESRLVARDTTSTFPERITALPDVGYVRALSPEGLLSLSPDLILAIDGAGPPPTFAVMSEADVALAQIPEGFDPAALRAKILAVGAALELDTEARALADRVDADLALAAAQARAAQAGSGLAPRRVLFVLSATGGRILAGGQNTAADAMIALAGGQNAVEGIEGYKPLTPEALIAAAPDVVLVMARGGGGPAPSDAELLSLPGLDMTPAAQSGAVLRMDGMYLLGFGPRTGNAVRDLAAGLYGGRT